MNLAPHTKYVEVLASKYEEPERLRFAKLALWYCRIFDQASQIAELKRSLSIDTNRPHAV